MNNEEAIKELKAEKVAHINNGYSGNAEYFDLAIEALEMQIPQKGIPYNSAKNHNFVECSACNKDMGMYYKYCPNCGQKINWS